MSTFTVMTTDPKELRPLLHRRLDDASDVELAAIHHMLLELESRRMADELGAALKQDWDSGRITEAKITESILDHRSKHPYR